MSEEFDHSEWFSPSWEGLGVGLPLQVNHLLAAF